MGAKVHKHTSAKKTIRYKKKKRIRSRLSGTSEQPRLSVFKSNANLFLQLVDDEAGKTLCSASTLEKANKGKFKNNLEGAKQLGQLIAKRATEKNISKVVFDRSGYIYHGKIKALADAAREAGLKF